MFESFKKQKDEKNAKVNRATVLTFVGLALAVGIIVVSGIVANRAKKKEEQPKDNTPITQLPEDTEPEDTGNDVIEPEDTTPDTSDKPSSVDTPADPDRDEQVENKLPSFILPVSGTLNSKHDPTLQVFSPTMNDYRVHLGVDITTNEAAPVYSAADGTVEKIWKDTLMGYCMAIKHSGDCYTIYKNLSETLPEGIAEGSSVRSGQLIATVGDSAMIEIADEPHLHFEMTVGDLAVDPLEYFDEKALESLSIDASYEE